MNIRISVTGIIEFYKIVIFCFSQVGFKQNGRITSLDASYYSNGGNSIDLSHGVSRKSTIYSDSFEPTLGVVGTNKLFEFHRILCLVE